MKPTALIFLLSLSLLSSLSNAQAAGKKTAPNAANSEDAQDADVSRVKQKYWARGDESEMGVVQSRLYTKEHKLELGFFGGVISTDPFLSVHNYGATLAYHVSEYFAVDLLAWKTTVTGSSALSTLQSTLGVGANTNEPRYFYGGEIQASLLYGKLSFVGSSIIYYDLHFLGGAGLTNTETGTYLTPIVGLGQQVYLSQVVSIKVDYRLTPYYENINEKVIVAKLGQQVDQRWNYSDVITLGVSFLF